MIIVVTVWTDDGSATRDIRKEYNDDVEIDLNDKNSLFITGSFITANGSASKFGDIYAGGTWTKVSFG